LRAAITQPQLLVKRWQPPPVPAARTTTRRCPARARPPVPTAPGGARARTEPDRLPRAGVPTASDPEDLFYDVAAACEKVRAPGLDALAVAFREASETPVMLSLTAPGLRFVRLISAAYYLQKFRGALPIQLPGARLGSYLDCSPRRVSAMLRYARKRGIIIEVDGTWSHVRRKAKDYRFNFDSPHYLAPAPYAVDGPCWLCGEPSGYRDGTGTFACSQGTGCATELEGIVENPERAR
jgi:hypothetical protein